MGHATHSTATTGRGPVWRIGL